MRSPTSISLALMGVPTTSRTRRMPGSQIVWPSLLTSSALPGARSRSRTIAGRPRTAMEPSIVLRTRGRRPMPDSSRPALSASIVAARSSGGEEPGWRISTISTSLMSLRARWMIADPDEQQGHAQRHAEGDGGGTHAGPRVPVVADLEREVGDDEQHREDHREDEHRRDLALGALLGLLVDVGRAPVVRRQARVGDRLGRVGREVRVAVRLERRVGVGFVAHAFTLLFLVRVVCEAIQMAPADETADAHQPREEALGDGAEPAEAEAAVLGGGLDAVEVGDDVALVLGGQVAVAEVGHLLRPGQQRLEDVLALDAVQRRGVAAAGHRAATRR